MDQVKIGRYLQELRKEKGYTQEQLAEHLNVARRTVSRWETGSNMPDLDLLIELSDFYGVGLRELLDGERKEKEMNREMEETV
ncbi:MAG: helix-turn-helix transcriptional regulator, partial [Solobacterium sp.]|nr:helix-turn-helix transcriptional regulator [Solobacterium sp.]